ncbi:MAG: hypothetical protein ABL921_22925 [Pirellula sp.]
MNRVLQFLMMVTAFALIPAICFGSIAVITWGQFVTAPLMLAMCHSLPILWVVSSNKSRWWALKLLAAFVVLVFTHATATSIGVYQTDFPSFSNALASHATFTTPSTILIGVIVFVTTPYLRIATSSYPTQSYQHRILGLISATAAVACVMSYLTTIKYVGNDRFLYSQIAMGALALTCLWCVLSRQSKPLRHTLWGTTLATLVLTTAILFACRVEASKETLILTLYFLSITAFISIERIIELRFPQGIYIEPQNNKGLQTTPSISRFDLRRVNRSGSLNPVVIDQVAKARLG